MPLRSKVKPNIAGILGGLALFFCLTQASAFAENQPPQFTSSIGNKTAYLGKEITFTITAQDAEGDRIRFGGSAIPIGSIYQDNGNGTATFKWTPAKAGDFLMVFSVYDDYHDYRQIQYQKITISVLAEDPGTLIGPEGGEVASADGKVKVVIPQGALPEAKYIKISSIDNDSLKTATPQGKGLLSAVECEPRGLVFNHPVTLIYTLLQAEVPGTSIELGYYDSVQKKILSTGQFSNVSIDGYTLAFSLMHFSAYAALKDLTSQGAPIGPGVKIPLPDMFTGSFSNSIPISVVPGRKKIQPSLALVYRSSNPNSWVGTGFSLNPGYIVRSTRLGPPSYDDIKDTFYFITDAGTTELVHLVNNLYQAKIESAFTKFFKEANDTWRVLTKDGSVLLFGTTAESKETSGSGTFSWYFSKAVDTNGNYIEYSYIKDQGKSYLLRIDYTGNASGISPTNSVEFSLEPREDISSSYISTARVATAKRLREIQVKMRGELAWRYRLEYAYSPDTFRSLLKSITQYASDDKQLPTQSFTYQEAE